MKTFHQLPRLWRRDRSCDGGLLRPSSVLACIALLGCSSPGASGTTVVDSWDGGATDANGDDSASDVDDGVDGSVDDDANDGGEDDWDGVVDGGCVFGDDYGVAPVDQCTIAMCHPLGSDCIDGEKCAPVVLDPFDPIWHANVCVPAGDQPVGAPCHFVEGGVNGQDTCDAQGICWGVDPVNGIGTCVEQCVGEVHSCPLTGLTCVVPYATGVVTLCLPACDPLVESCPQGTRCVGTYAGGREAITGFACAPTDTLGAPAPGEPCRDWDSCQGAALCDDVDVIGLDNCPEKTSSHQTCCTALCDVNAPDPDLVCTDTGLVGTVCVALYSPGTPEPLGKVGKCMLPS